MNGDRQRIGRKALISQGERSAPRKGQNRGEYEVSRRVSFVNLAALVVRVTAADCGLIRFADLSVREGPAAPPCPDDRIDGRQTRRDTR